MNGRIYDPTLGRFLQADPFIQAPSNTQSFNRYAYVWNNPLRYTDPSGYFTASIRRGLIKAATKVFGKDTVNFIGTLVSGKFGGAPGVAAWTYEFNRAMGVPPSGSLRAAAVAGASAYTFQQIGDAFNADTGFWAEGGAGHIGAHAVAGGTFSALGGGNFGHGFWSAGLTKAANVNGMISEGAGEFGYDALRVITAAAIGGTISELTGGKFANGATTAAFAQAFNANEALAKKAKKAKKAKIDAMLERIGKGVDLASKGNDVLTIYKAVDKVSNALSVGKMQNELLELIPHMSPEQIELLVPSLAGMPEPIIQKMAVLRLNNYYKTWHQTGVAVMSAGTDITTMVLTNMMPGGIARTLFALEIGKMNYGFSKSD